MFRSLSGRSINEGWLMGFLLWKVTIQQWGEVCSTVAESLCSP